MVPYGSPITQALIRGPLLMVRSSMDTRGELAAPLEIAGDSI
jgi:hypothetical protein